MRIFTAVFALVALHARAVEGGVTRPFDIPAGDASVTLGQFARQYGGQFLYLSDSVRGVPTNAVRGEMPPREALERMLAGTALRAASSAPGVLAVERAPPAGAAPPVPASRAGTPARRPPASRPAPEPPAPGRSVMSPFELIETLDNSFGSPMVGSGGRMQLDLADTPVAYSVINRELIEALGITNLREAASWATGQTFYSSDNGGDAFGRPSQYFSRGNLTSQGGASSFGSQRNFYQNTDLTGDSYSIESYEFGRGPNAALFGQGSGLGGDAGNGGLGGVSSTRTKQVRFDGSRTAASFELGQWGYRRATLDENRVLNARVGLRVNAVAMNARGWRLLDMRSMRGLTGTASVRLGPRTELRMEGATEQSRSHNVGSGWDEYVSGWDGRTIVRGPLTNAMFATGAAPGATVSGSSQLFGVNPVTGVTGITFSGAPNGVDRIGGPRYQYDPYFGTVMNYQNFPISRRADDTSRTPLWSRLSPNGEYFVRGTNVHPEGSRFGTDVPFGVGRSFHLKEGLPADMFARAARNSRFRIPGERFEASADHPTAVQRMRDAQFTLSHRLGPFAFLEVGGDLNRATVVIHPWDNPSFAGGGGRTMTLDLDLARPDGSPNPGFLDTFVALPMSRVVDVTTDRTLRANLGYVADRGRFGRYTLNLNANLSERDFASDTSVFSLRDPVLSADRRRWGAQQMRILLYGSDGVRAYKEPATVRFTDVNWADGDAPLVQAPRIVRPGWVPTNWSESRFRMAYGLAQLTAKMLDGRAIFTGAFRRDLVTGSLRLPPAGAAGGALSPDVPVDWDGSTRLFRPDAPPDYFRMTYLQRAPGGAILTGRPVPSGNRPRTTVDGVPNVAVSEYRDDRFRDDFNPPGTRTYESTRSVGLMLHLAPVFSPYFNYADTYTPNASGALDLAGRLRLPTRARGFDAGMSARALGGRVEARLNWFHDVRENDPNSPAVAEHINLLLQSNRFDDPDATLSGRNARGMDSIAVSDYQDRSNQGYEIEIVAMPAQGWRLLANGSESRFKISNRSRLSRDFVPANAELLRDLLQDAGGVLDPTRRPDLAPNAPGLAVAAAPGAFPGAPLLDQEQAVNAYNNLWIAYEALVREPVLRIPNQPTINFVGDYTVQTGALRRFRIGAGVQWQGRTFLVSRANQTVLDPSNPVPYAVDDPSADQGTLGYAQGSYHAQLNFGYSFVVAGVGEVELGLRVNNPLNNRRPVASDAGVFSGLGGFGVLRQPDGDLTRPNRTLFPDLVARFPEPVNFRLTTTLRFDPGR